MNTIRRWISTKAYKHIKLYVIMFIVLLNIMLVLVDGIIIHMLSPHDFPTVKSGIWQIFTDILDPGFLGTNAVHAGTPATRTVEVIAIVLCMVTFTGAIIGYISSMVTSIIDNSEGGPKRMFLKNHIVILNWNNRAAGIISEYLFTDICEDVVVLSNQDRKAINKEIEDSILELGYNRKQKHVNYVVKQGEPFSYTELDNVCIRQARTVIILSDQDPQDGDLRTLKTVLMVSQMNQGRRNCAIVVEADNPNIYELVCRIRENKECNIVPAYLNKLLGKLLAHIALQPKLNVVFAEILSHNGNEFYSVPIERLPGINSDSSEEDIINTYLQNYDHAIPLLTSRHFRREGDERLFVLSGHSTYVYNKREQSGVLSKHVSLSKSVPLPVKKIIVLGSNSKLRYMINSFVAYIGCYGTDKLHIDFIDDADALEQIPSHESFKTHVLNSRNQLREVRSILDGLDLASYDTIVVLSDDNVSAVEYDAGALVSLIDINKALERIPEHDRPEVIMEILNPKNVEILRQYNINNVIVSNKYISSLVAQLGDDDTIFSMIYDILTFDKEIDDFGEAYSGADESRELYVKRAGDYFEHIDVFSSLSELIVSVYESSGRDHILLGIIYHDDNKNKRDIDLFEHTYTFKSDLDTKRTIHIDPDDQLVIYSREW